MSSVPPDDFDVSVSSESGVAVVAVHGELDLRTAPVLTAALAPLPGPVVFDLRGCSFVDSSGFAVVIRRQNQQPVAFVCGPGGGPRRTIDLMLGSDAPVHESAADAARSLAA